MVNAVSQLMTVPEFLAWKPETGRFELHDGVIVEIQPTGAHEQLVGLLNRKLNAWLDREDLSFFIPSTAMIQPLGFESGYRPDVLVIDPAGLEREPLWARESIVTLGSSVRLAVEVVSSNWPDDYARKFEDYEVMGIEEYWIVDYLGLGGRRYIGSPKQPTMIVCQLVKGVYETMLLRSGDRLESLVFPGFQLMTDPVFSRG